MNDDAEEEEARIVRKLLAEIERVKKLYALKPHIVTIRACTPEVFEMPDPEKLKALGIEGCKVLQYWSDNRDVIAPPDRKIAGRMVPVMTPSGRKSSSCFARAFRNSVPPKKRYSESASSITSWDMPTTSLVA